MQLKYLAAFADVIETPSLVVGPRSDLVQHSEMIPFLPMIPNYGGFVNLNYKGQTTFFGTSYSTRRTTPTDSPEMMDALQNSFANSDWLVIFLNNEFVTNYPIIIIVNKEGFEDIIDFNGWSGNFIKITKAVGMELLKEFAINDRIENNTVLKIKEVAQ